MLSIADRLLDEARRRGVRLWADTGLLRFDGPQTALDERFLNLVRDHREGILRRLEGRLTGAGSGASAWPAPSSGAWLNPLVAGGGPHVLFVVPAAGSGPRAFRRWCDLLPPGIDLVVVHLPGREERLDERPYTELDSLAGQIADSIGAYLDGCGPRSFAIFGHSLGALIAHEVAKRVAGPALRALIVAGSPPPEFADVTGAQADDDELLAALAEWAGTPAELLADRAALTAFLPCLRADLQVSASARRPFADHERLAVPIMSLAGRDDPSLPGEQAAAWSRWTSAGFTSHTVEGGHFFPLSPIGAAEQVVGLVAGALGVPG